MGRPLNFLRWWALALAVLTGPAGAAERLPDALGAYGDWRLQGRGELRWLGLHIYDASLWMREGDEGEDGTLALGIRYRRAFSARQLADASVDEMRRQGHAEAVLTRWGELLAAALPAVVVGDTVVGVHRPGLGLAFWHRGRQVADIADPQLARAFFDIWLGPHSRNAALRDQLQGAPGGG